MRAVNGYVEANCWDLMVFSNIRFGILGCYCGFSSVDQRSFCRCSDTFSISVTLIFFIISCGIWEMGSANKLFLDMNLTLTQSHISLMVWASLPEVTMLPVDFLIFVVTKKLECTVTTALSVASQVSLSVKADGFYWGVMTISIVTFGIHWSKNAPVSTQLFSRCRWLHLFAFVCCQRNDHIALRLEVFPISLTGFSLYRVHTMFTFSCKSFEFSRNTGPLIEASANPFVLFPMLLQQVIPSKFDTFLRSRFVLKASTKSKSRDRLQFHLPYFSLSNKSRPK